MPDRGTLRRVDTSVPHPARVYDYYLGGKDNFAADRAVAEAGLAAFPGVIQSARANRAFMGRVVRYLTAEAGIRGFLDIGTGLPSVNSTHEVAQSIAPESRIAYVDNDPIVLMHAEALLTSGESGETGYVEADLRDPERILREAVKLLDFSRPVAITLFSIMHFISDDDRPHEIVKALLEAVPPGSYLAISHAASDLYPEGIAQFVRVWNERAKATEKSTPRGHAEVARFFDGLDVVEPGVVQISKWRPSSKLEADAIAALWGAVARKPLRWPPMPCIAQYQHGSRRLPRPGRRPGTGPRPR